jgi:membrane fusion protein, copper/silver efflux system
MRLIYLFILITWLSAGCTDKKIGSKEEVLYTCSMHPKVISRQPGKCPICNMQLTPVQNTPVSSSDDLQLSDQQIELGNIQTDTIINGNIGEEIVLTGILNLDGDRIRSVNARVMGRIEKLYMKNEGDYVSKGMPLYELYSEELNNAKQEYILALQRKKLFIDQSLIDFENIIESTRHKLLLWGMTAGQINALSTQQQALLTTTFHSPESGYITSVAITEGSYVTEGGAIIEVAELSSLWAEAQVYVTQLAKVPRAGTAKIRVPDAGIDLNGKIDFINPELAPDSRINLVRVTVPNHGYKLKPGMSVYISFKTTSRNSLNVVTDAVIREKKGATVWLKTGPNSFRSQMVTTGIENNGVIEITHGLKAGDIVVVSGTYLLHSEYILKRGTDPMIEHNH